VTPTIPPQSLKRPMTGHSMILPQVNCGGALEPSAVELSWSDVSAPDSFLPSVESLDLTFTNRTSQRISIAELRLVGDAAGRLIVAEIAPFLIEPADTQTRSIPLLDLGINQAEMEVSGSLVAEARLFGEDGASMGKTSTSAIYFHPELAMERFVVYGEATLRAQYQAGDFVTTLSDINKGAPVAPPNPRRRRVMQGGFELVGGAE
jgi:hypothetical protein